MAIKTKMSQILNQLYLVASLLFLLQLGNAQNDEKAVSADLKNNENKDDNYEAPFLTSIKNIHNSQTATVVREGSKMAAQTLGGKLKEFQTELNKISKKRENGPHDLLPNIVKFDIIDPAKAATAVLVNTVSKPVINYKNDLLNHYNAEREKQKADENPSKLKKWFGVPLAVVTATKNVSAGRYEDLKALKTDLLLRGKNPNTKQTSGEIEKTKSTN